MKTNLNNSVVLYQSPDGSIQLDVKLDHDTVWLTQQQLGTLFNVDRTVVVKHIKNIYKSGELEEGSTCVKNAQVQIEGKRTVRREIPFYSLISLFFRGLSLAKMATIPRLTLPHQNFTKSSLCDNIW